MQISPPFKKKKVLDTYIQFDLIIPRLGIYLREMKTHVLRNVHSSFIHNCQEWQQPRCPTNSKWRNCVCPHRRTLLHHEKKRTANTCDGLQGAQDCDTEWKKPDRKATSWMISFTWNSSKHKLICSHRQQIMDAWDEGGCWEGKEGLPGDPGNLQG